MLEHRRTNSSESYADVDNFNNAAFFWTHLYLLPIGHELKTIFSRHGFALTKAPGPGRRVIDLRCGCRTQQNYRSTKGTRPGLGPCSNPVVLNTWSGDPWRVSEILSVGLPGQNYFHNNTKIFSVFSMNIHSGVMVVIFRRYLVCDIAIN